MGMSGGLKGGGSLRLRAEPGHERMSGTGYFKLMISTNLFLEQNREGQLA